MQRLQELSCPLPVHFALQVRQASRLPSCSAAVCVPLKLCLCQEPVAEAKAWARARQLSGAVEPVPETDTVAPAVSFAPSPGQVLVRLRGCSSCSSSSRLPLTHCLAVLQEGGNSSVHCCCGEVSSPSARCTSSRPPPQTFRHGP